MPVKIFYNIIWQFQKNQKNKKICENKKKCENNLIINPIYIYIKTLFQMTVKIIISQTENLWKYKNSQIWQFSQKQKNLWKYKNSVKIKKSVKI